MNVLERRLRKMEQERRPAKPLNVDIIIFGDGPLPESHTNNNVTVRYVRSTDLEQTA